MPNRARLVTRSNTTSTNSVQTLNKGSKLTFAEMDSNFLELQNQTIGIADDGSTVIEVGAGNTLTVAGTGGIQTSVSGQTLTIDGSSITTSSIGDLSVIGSTITAPSNADLTLTVAGTGQIVVDGTLTATEITSDLTGTIEFDAKADVNLAKGEVVYISGIDGNTPTVAKARANSASTMPAFGLVAEDITATNTGKITTIGSLVGLDVADFGETSITFALGDTVYVSAAEAGKLTNVKPAGESNLIQNIGIIIRATPTSNITIKVGGAGRTNATPALDDGNIFIGNASNQSSTVALSEQIKNYKAITLTGDDSTGTDINIGETFQIAGTQNITTAVSGDTLTITGPDLSSYATQSYVTSQGFITNSTTTIVGDDSTGTTLNSGETIKIAGTQNVSTAVSGDTLTITGPDLSSYITDANLTIVGDDSTGTTFSAKNNDDITITGTGGITSTVSGNTITIDGSGITGGTTGDLTFVGSTILGASNADITIEPNGVADLRLNTDTVHLGSGSENVILQSNGTQSLGLKGGGTQTFTITPNDASVGAPAMLAGTQFFVVGTGTDYARVVSRGPERLVLQTDDGNGTSYINIYHNGAIEPMCTAFNVQGSGGNPSILTSDVIKSQGIEVNDNKISAYRSNDDIILDAAGTGNVSSLSQLNMNSNKIVNVTDPTSAQDAATKAYVDANVGSANTGDITFVGSTIISPSNADLTLDPAGTGKVNIAGAYTLPAADGTVNQILGTNGSGVISFVDPTAINIDGGTAESIYTSVPTIDGGAAV